MMRSGAALAIGKVRAVRVRRGIRRPAINRLDVRLVVLTTTTFALFAYLVCIAIGLGFPSSMMWVASLTGFSWTIAGVLFGLVQIASYAALSSAAYVWLYNAFSAKLNAWPRQAGPLSG